MSSSFVRPLIIGGLLLVLIGCSALRLGYSQGPTLAFWWVDRYIDFDASQSTKVRQALNDWFRWHRATQLEDLETLLKRAEIEALAPATPTQVCRWSNTLSTRLMQAYEHAVPAIADIAVTLRPEQLKKLARRYDGNNDKFRDEYLQSSPEDRLLASVKRFSERAEDFYGPLNAGQRALIKRRTAESPFDPQIWLAERRARQQDILTSLRRWTSEPTSIETVRSGLQLLGQQVRQSGRDDYRQYQQRLLDYNCAFIAEFHNSTTRAQRQRLVERLKDWESDINQLISESSS